MARALFDLVSFVLFGVLVGVPLAALGWLHGALTSALPTPAVWALFPAYFVLFVLGMTALAFLVRVCLPRLEPGEYPFPNHRMSVSWALTFALSRVVYLPLWSFFIFGFSTLRYLLLRALGAKVAYQMNTSSDAVVLDPQMMEIGPETMLAADTLLAGHLVEKDVLKLGRVVLGEGVQALGGVKIGPNTRVGPFTQLGPETRIAGDVEIGEYAHLGAGCVIHNHARIASNAVLGHQVVLETGVQVGAGAVVLSGTRVPKNTRITEGQRYPPRKAQA